MQYIGAVYYLFMTIDGLWSRAAFTIYNFFLNTHSTGGEIEIEQNEKNSNLKL